MFNVTKVLHYLLFSDKKGIDNVLKGCLMMLPIFVIVLILSLSVVAQIKFGVNPPIKHPDGRHALNEDRRKA